MRLFFGFALVAVCALGKSPDMAVTSDGGQLYLSSTLARDGQFGRTVLIYSNGSLTRFRQDAEAPSVSADGSRLVYSSAGGAILLGAESALPLKAPATISRDGRFVLTDGWLVDLDAGTRTQVAGALALADQGIV